jgi:hypothetical protein
MQKKKRFNHGLKNSLAALPGKVVFTYIIALGHRLKRIKFTPDITSVYRSPRVSIGIFTTGLSLSGQNTAVSAYCGQPYALNIWMRPGY